MRLSRSRLSTRHDFEYAIKWENLRSSYFRAHGESARADQCTKALSELEWRLAMLPTTDQNEATAAADSFVDSDWSTAAEPMTNAGWHQEVKEPVAV